MNSEVESLSASEDESTKQRDVSERLRKSITVKNAPSYFDVFFFFLKTTLMGIPDVDNPDHVLMAEGICDGFREISEQVLESRYDRAQDVNDIFDVNHFVDEGHLDKSDESVERMIMFWEVYSGFLTSEGFANDLQKINPLNFVFQDLYAFRAVGEGDEKLKTFGEILRFLKVFLDDCKSSILILCMFIFENEANDNAKKVKEDLVNVCMFFVSMSEILNRSKDYYKWLLDKKIVPFALIKCLDRIHELLKIEDFGCNKIVLRIEEFRRRFQSNQSYVLLHPDCNDVKKSLEYFKTYAETFEVTKSPLFMETIVMAPILASVEKCVDSAKKKSKAKGDKEREGGKTAASREAEDALSDGLDSGQEAQDRRRRRDIDDDEDGALGMAPRAVPPSSGKAPRRRRRIVSDDEEDAVPTSVGSATALDSQTKKSDMARKAAAAGRLAGEAAAEPSAKKRRRGAKDPKTSAKKRPEPSKTKKRRTPKKKADEVVLLEVSVAGTPTSNKKQTRLEKELAASPGFAKARKAAVAEKDKAAASGIVPVSTATFVGVSSRKDRAEDDDNEEEAEESSGEDASDSEEGDASGGDATESD